MDRFSTQIKTLLRIRENRRDQHRVRLAQVLRDDEAIALSQAELAQKRDRLLDQYRKAVGPGELNVDQLLEYRQHDGHLAVEQKQLEGQRVQVAQRIARQQAALVAAEREVRTIEILEEKQEERQCEKDNRQQINQFDEMAARSRDE